MSPKVVEEKRGGEEERRRGEEEKRKRGKEEKRKRSLSRGSEVGKSRK